MKFYHFLLIATFQLSALVHAVDTPQALYDAGNFSEALSAYEGKATKDPSDYYNMGNTHFKMGALGKAVAYYEKTLSLLPPGDPRREDAAYNLDLVESKLRASGSLQEDRSFWSGRVVPFSKNKNTTFFWLLAAVSSWIAALLVIRSRKNTKDGVQHFMKNVTQPSVLLFMALTLFLSAGALLIDYASQTPLAIVSEDSVVARSGPGASFTELYRLLAGSKVTLLNGKREGWLQIRFSGENVGWVLENQMIRL